MEVNAYSVAYILWNIFLALVPCWLVYFLSQHKKLLKKPLLLWPILALWLFMLPNTAYLFLMPRHLLDYCADYNAYRVCQTAGSWQVMFFSAYALIGLPTFYYALNKMSRLLKLKWLPLAVIPLTGVGLMFGLYERFNSWDILSKPVILLQVAASYFLNAAMLKDLLIFTGLLFVIYYVSEFFIKHD